MRLETLYSVCDLWIQSTISAEAGNRGEVTKKDSQRTLKFNGVDRLGIHRRPTEFWRILYLLKGCQPGQKVTETGWHEGRTMLEKDLSIP